MRGAELSGANVVGQRHHPGFQRYCDLHPGLRVDKRGTSHSGVWMPLPFLLSPLLKMSLQSPVEVLLLSSTVDS